MSNGSLAKRYARALFALGNESGLTEQFNSELASLSDTLALNNNELMTALTTPVFKIEERKHVANVVCEKLELHETVRNFVYLLLDKDRLELQEDIVRIFAEMADKKAGRVRATVHTATEISDDDKSKIAETLSTSLNIAKDKLIIDFGVRPELISGVWAKVGDRTYDATVLSKLEDMKVTLLSK